MTSSEANEIIALYKALIDLVTSPGTSRSVALPVDIVDGYVCVQRTVANDEGQPISGGGVCSELFELS